jgi:hypothetical protein
MQVGTVLGLPQTETALVPPRPRRKPTSVASHVTQVRFRAEGSHAFDIGGDPPEKGPRPFVS